MRLKRRNDLVEEMITLGNVAPHRRACGQKRHAHRSGLQCQRQRKVRHIEDAQLFTGLARILNLSGMAEVIS